MATPQESNANDQSALAFIRVSHNEYGASYGALVRTDRSWFGIAERTEYQTPNFMELVGVSRVLDSIRSQLGPSTVRLFVSEYVSKGYTLYLPIWVTNEWRSKGGEIAHSDVWMDLTDQVSAHTNVGFETLASKGPDKKLWRNERTAAATLATRVGTLGYSCRDVTKAFRPRFDASRLSGANDDDPRDGY